MHSVKSDDKDAESERLAFLFIIGLILIHSLSRTSANSLVVRNKNVNESPPLGAEMLLCVFARTKDIEALLGDFEELFERDKAAGMSKSRSRARFWARVLRSIGPQMWQAARRLGVFGLIMAALKR